MYHTAFTTPHFFNLCFQIILIYLHLLNKKVQLIIHTSGSMHLVWVIRVDPNVGTSTQIPTQMFDLGLGLEVYSGLG